MSQDNQFHQYGYDHYLKAPRKNRSKSGGGIGSRIFESLQSPMVATGALLVTGVVFATIIVLAYPSADDPAREIPIVRADLSPVKTVPDDLGVTEFPNSDNTVLANIGQPRPDESTGQVENLMAAPSEEDFVSKEQALEQAMATQSPEADPVGQALGENVTPTLIQEAQKLESSQDSTVTAADAQTLAPNAENVIQKIDGNQTLASGETDDKPTMHAAATSPETIDFVRSVLNADNPGDLETEKTKTVTAKGEQIEENVSEVSASEITEPEAVKPLAIKEASVEEKVEEVAVKVVEIEEKPKKQEEPKAAKEVAKIAPAAGAASSAINIQSGIYYVQLASITDRSRADKEYSKLQKKFSVLDDIDFRVQEANLDKGMFYRIQAGPMSKDSAKQVCAEIKKQKPEGCIVTK